MSDSDSSGSKDGDECESNSSDGSSSSSDFDELSKAFMAERKRMRRSGRNRVSADGMAILETSSSEDSSPPRVRRRTAQPISESDPNLLTSEDEHEIVCYNIFRSPPRIRSVSPTPPVTSGPIVNGPGTSSGAVKAQLDISDSDSGGECADKCPICLRGIKLQEVGSPEGCDHNFCFTCLQKWSQSCNRCPLDRQPFSIILVRDNLHGHVVRQIQVTKSELDMSYDFMDNVFCQVCRGYNNEEAMLLCDRCDSGYHLECLTPPLTEIPYGSWFCPNCASLARESPVDLNFSGLLRATLGHITRPPLNRSSRADWSSFFNIPLLMPTTDEQPQPTPAQTQPSTTRAGSSRRPATRKRKRKAKRKKPSTVSRNTVLLEGANGEVTEETVVVKKCVYRRKKKKKGKKPAKKRAKPTVAPSTSIIPALRRQFLRSMGRPLVPTVPRGHRHTSRNRSHVSRVSRISTLSLFEDRYQLAPVSSDSEIEGFDGEVATLTRRRMNLSTRTLERSKAIELFNAPAPPRPVPVPCEDRADLLSSILESQSFWHSKNSSTVKSDGKVDLRPKNNPVDVRNAGVERTSTAAPVFPESESHSGSLRSRTENFSNVSEPGPSGTAGDAVTASSSRTTAPVNDREGYRNFLNNIPLGPTPICRTGAPLRFRMPVRPQLRRIPLLPRRPAKNAAGNEEDEEETPDEKKKDGEKHSEEEPGLYSDVEMSVEKEGDNTDNEAANGTATGNQDPNNPDAYDPADPCDSDEELAKVTPVGSPAKLSNDEECPVFSLYSSDSVAFSRKDEEERANLAEKMTQHESAAGSSAKLSFNPDVSQEDSVYSIDGKCKRTSSLSPVAPRRRHSSSSSQSSSPGTPRRIRNLPKGDQDSYHRTYRKRGGSASSERDASSSVRKENEEQPPEPSRVTTGLEGLDVEAVSSGNELEDDRLSSLSLSGVSSQSRHSSPVAAKKRRRKKSTRERTRSGRCASEEGEINSDKDVRKKRSDENKSDSDKKRRDRSKSASPSRQILGSKENKKELSWKKPSRADKKFRNSRKTAKEKDRKRKRESASPSPKRDKRKSKDKKKSDKKKEIERYDVRKVVKGKPAEKKDEFGRDVKSRSLSSSSSKSRSRSRNRTAARRSRSRSHSPARRARRRARFRSGSPSKNRKRPKSAEKDGRKSRRSRSKKRSVSPRSRVDKKVSAVRRSWSHSSMSSPARSPVRKRRTVTPPRRRRSSSWSRGASPSRDPPLQNLTVVVKPKDKKKKKGRGEKSKLESKKKKTGNLKEVFASGDNVLVSVNFSKSSKSNCSNVIPLVTPVRLVSKRRKRSAERSEKAAKATNAVSKTVIDAALSTQPPKRKKVTRLNDEDAEKILNQKPVAVIDLDESPYREQTPSPINVVVVSDSGSGDEAQPPVPQLPRADEIAIVTSSPPVAPAAISGPKTPPEPPLKFSIAKVAHIRPIANPLAEEEEEEPEEEAPVVIEHKENSAEPPVESQQHKGPNTPLSTPPRGPSTPKTPPSPQSSPDAYDPFKPTQSPTSNTASDHHVVKESPIAVEPAVEIVPILTTDEPAKPETSDDAKNEIIEIVDLTENVQPVVSTVESIDSIAQQPKRTTPQPVTSGAVSALSLFPLRSPSKTPNRPQSVTTAVGVSGIQRLQHRLGSPVNKTPNSVKSTPEKRAPELLSDANSKLHNVNKRNGPLQDTTNEPVDMDDSPYSPATSEGDDLFEPPPPPSGQPPAGLFKPPKPTGKTVNKFDILFGGGNTSPIRNGSKKAHKSAKHPKPPTPLKHGFNKKTPTKKSIPAKMDEDQLRILDEVPSSAVELQVKDKFLKKLNRQERVVDEVKTVLKPFYAAKRINKEEYKDILRRAVPKICHSKSGEINPSKIKHLVEAYVRKCPQKKPSGGSARPKLKKMMFS